MPKSSKRPTLSAASCKQIIAKARRREATVGQQLKKIGVSYASWYRQCQEHGVDCNAPRGRLAQTYTMAVRKEILARVSAGEYLSYACEAQGVNYLNYLRWCRRVGVSSQPDAHRRRNVQRRVDENREAFGRRIKRHWRLGLIKLGPRMSKAQRAKTVKRLHAMRKRGMTLKTIAAEMNWKPTKVIYYLKNSTP